jgi:hypothetical protein
MVLKTGNPKHMALALVRAFLLHQNVVKGIAW